MTDKSQMTDGPSFEAEMLRLHRRHFLTRGWRDLIAALAAVALLTWAAYD